MAQLEAIKDLQFCIPPAKLQHWRPGSLQGSQKNFYFHQPSGWVSIPPSTIQLSYACISACYGHMIELLVPYTTHGPTLFCTTWPSTVHTPIYLPTYGGQDHGKHCCHWKEHCTTTAQEKRRIAFQKLLRLSLELIRDLKIHRNECTVVLSNGIPGKRVLAVCVCVGEEGDQIHLDPTRAPLTFFW